MHTYPPMGPGPHLMGMGVGLVCLALTILAIVAVLFLMKRRGAFARLSHGRPVWTPAADAATLAKDPVESAMIILNERLARGEIEVDDYYQRRSALKGPDPLKPEPTLGD